MTDNLGIRPGLNRLEIVGDVWDMVKLRNLGDIKHLVFIVVNAQSESQKHFSRLTSPVPLLDTILGVTSIPLNEYTFESLVTLHTVIEKFTDGLIKGRCADAEYNNSDVNDCADFKSHLIYVDLDQLLDAKK